ncbi:MAG: RNase adapter RapZ [Proteobacteria bacterium]|nr:RNase adapter RapZ [Pseudomonadota bacterium]
MRIIFVSGVSGAGKTVFIKALEDLGFYCVDNLPVPLLNNFVKILKERKNFENVSVVIDIREKVFLEDIDKEIETIKEKNPDLIFQTVFLDARDEILLRRYSETRRKHPVDIYDIEKGIDEERYLLRSIRKGSDFIIDTSELTPYQLRKKAEEIAFGKIESSRLSIKIVSFGYKFGIPRDVDIIFDVRFIDNPFYVPHLRDKTGKDKEVIEFIRNLKQTSIFLDKVKDLLSFMFENFILQDKNIVTVAFGCTGGRHRSVFFAEEVYDFFKDRYHDIIVLHRDINH